MFKGFFYLYQKNKIGFSYEGKNKETNNCFNEECDTWMTGFLKVTSTY